MHLDRQAVSESTILHIEDGFGSARVERERAKLFVASDVFFCHVLRILLSEFDEGQDKPSLGTKESCPRTSGHPTLRIRRSAGAKVCAHDEK